MGIKRSNLKQRLFNIFLKYAKLESKLKGIYMQPPQLYSFATEAQILNTRYTKRNLTLALTSLIKNNTNITFSTFLDLLPLIAQAKYPEENENGEGGPLQKLLQDNILILEDNSENSDELDLEIIDLFRAVVWGLREVYKTYFPSEIRKAPNRAKMMQESLRNLEKFAQDIDICPTYFPKQKLYQLWKDLVILDRDPYSYSYILAEDHLELGTIFTFSKFCQTLYISATLCYENSTSPVVPRSSSERVLLLLQRMEMNRDYIKRNHRPNQQALSLLPSREIIEYITRGHLSQAVSQQISISTESESAYQVDDLDPVLGDHYKAELFKVFRYYATLGEGFNANGLNASNFMRLLKDCDLLSDFEEDEDTYDGRITTIESDLLFCRIRGGRKERYMNFTQFIRSLENIGKHWNPKNDFAANMQEIIENHILNFAATPRHDKGMMRRIKRILDSIYLQDLTGIFQMVNAQMIYFFHYYTRKQDLMNFNQFFAFSRDFNIFPGILTKIKLFQIFKVLADTTQQQVDLSVSSQSMSIYELTDYQSSQEVISILNFQQCLAVIATLAFPANGNLLSRYCSLLEVLAQGEGPTKVIASRGHSFASCGNLRQVVEEIRRLHPGASGERRPRRQRFNELEDKIKI